MGKDNDDLQDYRAGVLEKFVESVTKGIAIGGAIVGVGANIISGVVDFFGGIF